MKSVYRGLLLMVLIPCVLLGQAVPGVHVIGESDGDSATFAPNVRAGSPGIRIIEADGTSRELTDEGSLAVPPLEKPERGSSAPGIEAWSDPADRDSAASSLPVLLPPTGFPGSGTVPVGSVVAWLKGAEGTPPLPPEWAECNGQEINDPASPYDGKVIPNLNGAEGATRRFLRGSPVSGVSGGSETHGHPAYLSQKYGDSRKPVSGTAAVSHLPPFYEVVWVLRIK